MKAAITTHFSRFLSRRSSGYASFRVQKNWMANLRFSIDNIIKGEA